MQQLQIIVYQISILFFLGLTGFIAAKTKYLPKNSGVVLSGIVVKLTAPILIFITMSGYSFNSKIVADGIWIYFGGIVFILFAFGISVMASRRMSLTGTASNIYKMQSMFGNVLYIAFPLFSSLYGEKGIIYAVFFNLANDTILWTLGIYLLNKHHNNSWKQNIKHLVNGNTVAFTAGILCMVLNIQNFAKMNPLFGQAYKMFFETFQPLGKTTIYLSMLFIGMILANVKVGSLRAIISRYPIVVLSFLKLLFVPVIALFVLKALGQVIDPFAKNIIVLQLAMPSGTIVPALAAQYESNYEYATECVFFTTILSVLTLPIMVVLLKVVV